MAHFKKKVRKFAYSVTASKHFGRCHTIFIKSVLVRIYGPILDVKIATLGRFPIENEYNIS